MQKLIQGYDGGTAPSILVPKIGHMRIGPRGILSRNTIKINNVSDLVARDIRELRRVYPEIPNSKLQELIRINKTIYSDSF